MQAGLKNEVKRLKNVLVVMNVKCNKKSSASAVA